MSIDTIELSFKTILLKSADDVSIAVPSTVIFTLLPDETADKSLGYEELSNSFYIFKNWPSVMIVQLVTRYELSLTRHAHVTKKYNY